MRDVRRKAVRSATVSPAGRDSDQLRTHSARKAALAASRRFVSGHREHLVALGFFAALCAIVLSGPARLIEPDDLAYRASLYALRQGHLVLSNAQYQALNYQLRFIVIQGHVIGITQWDHLPDGSWISQKNPGYPCFVLPFFAAGLLRLAPLCYVRDLPRLGERRALRRPGPDRLRRRRGLVRDHRDRAEPEDHAGPSRRGHARAVRRARRAGQHRRRLPAARARG